jgi:hypothetical protein
MSMHPSTEGPESEDRAPEHSAAEGVQESATPDWEAFYRDYRKPDYIEGFEITTKLGGGMFGLVFHAVAGGWRVIVERYATDDGTFRELARGSRAIAVPVEAVSPR